MEQAVRTRAPIRHRAYAVAVAAVLAAFAVRLLLDGVLGASQPYSLFYPVVLGAAYLLGRGPAIVSAVLSGGLAFWIFVEPSHGFSYTASALTALASFVATATVAIWLITGLRTALTQLASEQYRIQGVADTHAGLFKELQARIGHHMNLLVGVLSFQAKGEPDPETLLLLRKVGERSQLIAQTFSDISDKQDSRIDFSEFSRSIARRICLETNAPVDQIEVANDRIVLPVEVATSLGVALAECLSWVMQRKPVGLLRVRFETSSGEIKVLVNHTGDTGSELVALAPTAYLFRAMVEQLGARVSFEGDDEEGPGLGISLPLGAPGFARQASPATLH